MGYNIVKYSALPLGQAKADGKFKWSAVVIQDDEGGVSPFCFVQRSILSQEIDVDLFFEDHSSQWMNIHQCETYARMMRDKNEKAADALMDAVRMVI